VSEERGQVTAFVVMFTLVLLFVAGLVVDGGFMLAARERAINDAEGAARAGAQAIDLKQYRATGKVVLDPDTAKAAAQRHLALDGATGSVVVTGNTVTVDLQREQPLRILGLVLGSNTVTVTGHGTADAVRGVTAAGS
jgi:Flp pilus assembly protein TadG